MGYTALYRQYRPLTFDKVAGQPHITTTLKNQVMGNRVAHAYLFAGTRGTGKTSTARIFARAVNCSNIQQGNPCNSCELCSKALAGKLMDIIEIDAASNRGVDEIRDLREKVKYPPAEGKYRVYIVDEVHMLTAEAFNALLKTLEEPPSHVIFILATTEPHRLPATVLSRCQRFDFKRIPTTEITGLLKQVAEGAGIDIDNQALEHIAGCADGSARDALSLMDKCSIFGGEHLTLDRVVSVLGMANEGLLFGLSEELSARNAAGCIMLLNQAVQEGRDIGQLFKDIIHHLRDILIAKVAPSGLSEMSEDKRDRLLAAAGTIVTNTLIRWINILSEAEAKAKWSTYPDVFLEVALVKLCEPSMDPSPEGIIDRLSRLEDIVLRNGAVYAVPGGQAGTTAGGMPVSAQGDDGDSTGGIQAKSCTMTEAKNNTETGELDGVRPDKENHVNTGEKVDAGNHKEASAVPDKEEDGRHITKEGAGHGDGKGDRAGGKEKTVEAGGDGDSGQNVSLEQMKEAWTKVLGHLENTKKGLYTILEGSRPVEMNGTSLVVGCDALHGIYHDIANRKESKDALGDAVFSVTGARLDISIKDTAGSDETSGDDTGQDCSLYEEAVSIFGSDLVDRIEYKDHNLEGC
ncbi:MAG: DNA polymerase III subunit gamma/tau [Clostridia bacterium]|jgi:DNA polymerase-3 subunit gamma/tau